MKISQVFLVLITSTLIYSVASIELVANYKYFKSAGDRFSYDYSGNARHASLFPNYIVTDSGLVPNSFYFPSLMSYALLPFDEYVFTFWMFNQAQASSVWFVVYHEEGCFLVYYEIAAASTTIGFSLTPNMLNIINSSTAAAFQG